MIPDPRYSLNTGISLEPAEIFAAGLCSLRNWANKSRSEIQSEYCQSLETTEIFKAGLHPLQIQTNKSGSEVQSYCSIILEPAEILQLVCTQCGSELISPNLEQCQNTDRNIEQAVV